MLLSHRKSGLNSLVKEVRVFKVLPSYNGPKFLETIFEVLETRFQVKIVANFTKIVTNFQK